MKTKRRQIPKKNRELILNRDGRKCFYCGSTERLTVDHIIPLKHGGSNLASNMITSCHSCNSTKNGNRLLPKFENAALNKAMLGNADFGIPQDKDISYVDRLSLPKKTRSNGHKSNGVEGKKKIGWKSRKVIKRIEKAFAGEGKIYMTETETSHESTRLLFRIKRRKGKYLSIPLNDKGGRIFLLNLYDKILKPTVATEEQVRDKFVELYAKNYDGYFSGGLGK